MTPEQWKKLDDLFHQALELHEESRAAFLLRACGDDERLREEAVRLIAAHEREGSFIDSPIFELPVESRDDDRNASPVGCRIGHYQVISLLGRGGMGKVVLAEDIRLERKVALKVLPAAFTQNPDRIHRFELEAKAASALNHPNILTIHEIGEADGVHYIVSEFVEGETLRALTERGRPDISEATAIADQVAAALSAAHKAGIIHRDIKPENVMVRPDGLVKVLDFGLAKLTEWPATQAEADSQAETIAQLSTEPGVVMGTVAYMSPEQARGLKVDQRTDIFSLGVILYEMIAGRRPFEGATTSDVIATLLTAEPPPLRQHCAEAPAELERITEKCLAKDREARYQVVNDLLLDLKRLRQESNSGASLAGVDHRLKWPWLLASRRQGNMLALAALVILLVAVGGLLWWYFRPESAPPIGRAVPLTSYPGFEINPSLSPDGNQVAFAWDGEKQDNFDIYSKLIGSSSPHRLTTNPAEDVSPAWSPDGRTIAFLRSLGGNRNELLLISALGGPERKLTETINAGNKPSRLPALAWSPAGRWLAVSHREDGDIAEGLFLVSAQTGEKRRLTRPSADSVCDFAPTFSPDGRTLLFTRFFGAGTAAEMYLLSLSEDFEQVGEARRLKADERFVRSPVWSLDGRHVLYLAAPNIGAREQTELRMIAVSDAGKSERVTLLEGEINEVSLGRHLVYTRFTSNNDIWRAEIPPPGGQASQPRLFISSTRLDQQPRYSPDGKKIAFGSTRSGAPEIWIADADGSNPALLTSFGGPLIGPTGWSPDSQRLVFHARPEGQADIFTIPANGGVPKRLTTDASDDVGASYSRDGRWIYFGSSRSGRLEIWKMPAEGGDAVKITSTGGRLAFESHDGRTLYFRHLSWEKGIWKAPVEGGAAAAVTGPVNEFAFAVGTEGVFYSPAPDSSQKGSIRFVSFATRKSRTVVVTDRPIGGWISLSPNQRFLLFAQRSRIDHELMLIENFVVR
jgi:eukaryotic-like serine/threonine-protein kinase